MTAALSSKEWTDVQKRVSPACLPCLSGARRSVVQSYRAAVYIACCPALSAFLARISARSVHSLLQTFTRWCNLHLAKREQKIEDLYTDLQTGVRLVHLVEVLSGKSVGGYSKDPKSPFQMLENLTQATPFAALRSCCLSHQLKACVTDWLTQAFDLLVKREKVHFINIGPEDIAGGNSKIVLGLICASCLSPRCELACCALTALNCALLASHRRDADSQVSDLDEFQRR